MNTIVVTAGLIGLLTASAPSRAALLWEWHYSGAGTTATGTFTTASTPDPNGFFLITSITGTVDGSAVTALTPPGQAIPGNDPYAVDDLIRPGKQQLTANGFGFTVRSLEAVNPFFNDGSYFAFISASSGNREPSVDFVATIVAEPPSMLLLPAALTILGMGLRAGASDRQLSSRYAQCPGLDGTGATRSARARTASCRA